jgi:hypothetical protein
LPFLTADASLMATTGPSDFVWVGDRAERSFLSNVGLNGAIALLALVTNGLLNNGLPSAWMFAIAIFGTLVIAAAVTTATHRSTRRR